ncbi:unnamed protein product [Schistocephalus solidus]|uniref:Serine/threonine-protein phosphatase 2A activator n=2 Tax=Schistocephalus solidus TaxID=70667 RepID=A0A3P7CZ29_SCHSO|nr:unnamed protein product [Schistocephalus solidus]
MDNAMGLQKMINSVMDLTRWKKSLAYVELMDFIGTVNSAVVSTSISENQNHSENISKVSLLMSKLKNHVDEVSLDQDTQRFGNKAFRTWFHWLSENAGAFCSELLIGLEISESDKQEIATYLTESVGNATRIDYGTGHELAFIAFVLCLFKTKFLQVPEPRPTPKQTNSNAALDDISAVALVLMPAYLKLVRRLQTYFRMEPAGSHGVWSLDDFQFVPYIWGSSQLIGVGLYEPKAISSREVAAKERDANLLFSCTDYIFQVKSGPFAEHSSTLQSISEIPHWEKVNSGMLKMYKGEVMDKFPIIQHFLFGNLLKIDPAPPRPFGSSTRNRMPPPSLNSESGLFRKPVSPPSSIPSSGDP